MKITTKFFLLFALILCVSSVSAESEYCNPPANFTTTIDHVGNWYNITITYPECMICTDTGGFMGDVECNFCSDAIPVTKFTTNITCGIVPFVVKFTDTSVGLNITDYYWDFGDGNASVEQNPAYQYNTTGAFTVSHSSTNEYGTDWYNWSHVIHSRPVGDTCGGTAVQILGDDAQSDNSMVIIVGFGALVVGLIIFGIRSML